MRPLSLLFSPHLSDHAKGDKGIYLGQTRKNRYSIKGSHESEIFCPRTVFDTENFGTILVQFWYNFGTILVYHIRICKG